MSLVDKLKKGSAAEILNAPPSKIDYKTEVAIEGRLGGNALGSEGAESLLEKDSIAKEILKMVVVLMYNRSEENVEVWRAAMLANAKIKVEE